jgi:hypothetical protein
MNTTRVLCDFLTHRKATGTFGANGVQYNYQIPTDLIRLGRGICAAQGRILE